MNHEISEDELRSALIEYVDAVWWDNWRKESWNNPAMERLRKVMLVIYPATAQQSAAQTERGVSLPVHSGEKEDQE